MVMIIPLAIGAAAAAGWAALIAGVMNYRSQKKNLDWQKSAQYQTWSREDMGVQRRVADLRAAGLSPTLAAGSAAPSGPINATTAPQIDDNPIQAALQAMTMASNISQTQAQTELTMAQTQKTKVDTGIAANDLMHYRQSGTTSNASPVGKIFRDIIGGYDSAPAGHIKGAIMEQLKKQTNLGDRQDAINKNRGTLSPDQQKIYDERMKKINPNYKAPTK